MQILRFQNPTFTSKLRKFNRRAIPSSQVRSTVEEIIESIRKSGESALLCYTEKFDGAKLTSSTMRVSKKEMANALASVEPSVHQALLASRKNVAQFAQKGLRRSWSQKNSQGALVGERFDPFERVGIYVPGGTAPLVSTAIMTCTLAQVAKVPEIVVTTPSGKDGSVDPCLLAALHLCGATEIYKVGGAQAIAAMAIGTRSISPVDKIFGPGNAYVVEAKRQLLGTVAIDLLPGPSEVMVIADSSAPPKWVAADLLAQAEHGHGSMALLVTPSAKLLDAVKEEIQKQIPSLARSKALADALKNTVLVHVRDLSQAIALANDFAPEHLSLALKDPHKHAPRIRTAGAIFLGYLSPIAAGDFLAGPSHVLPTGGAGKNFAGLTVDQFQRRTSLVEYHRDALKKSLPLIDTFSRIEGLDAHGRSASIRIPNQ